MRRTLARSAPLVLAFLCFAPGPARSVPAPPASVALVVHPATRVDNVSLDEVRRLFLGTMQTLDGKHVVLVESPRARTVFYRAALNLTELEVRRRWTALVFRGESFTMPPEFADGHELQRFVATHPGAVAYLGADEVDGSVKVLAVDHRRPGDAGYPLH